MHEELATRMAELKSRQKNLTARRVALEKKQQLRDSTMAEFSAAYTDMLRRKLRGYRQHEAASKNRNQQFLATLEEYQKQNFGAASKTASRSAAIALDKAKQTFSDQVELVYPAWQEYMQEMKLKKLRQLEREKREIEYRRLLAKQSFEKEQALELLLQQTSQDIAFATTIERNEAYERQLYRHKKVKEASELEFIIQAKAEEERRRLEDEHLHALIAPPVDQYESLSKKYTPFKLSTAEEAIQAEQERLKFLHSKTRNSDPIIASPTPRIEQTFESNSHQQSSIEFNQSFVPSRIHQEPPPVFESPTDQGIIFSRQVDSSPPAPQGIIISPPAPSGIASHVQTDIPIVQMDNIVPSQPKIMLERPFDSDRQSITNGILEANSQSSSLAINTTTKVEPPVAATPIVFAASSVPNTTPPTSSAASVSPPFVAAIDGEASDTSQAIPDAHSAKEKVEESRGEEGTDSILDDYYKMQTIQATLPSNPPPVEPSPQEIQQGQISQTPMLPQILEELPITTTKQVALKTDSEAAHEMSLTEGLPQAIALSTVEEIPVVVSSAQNLPSEVILSQENCQKEEDSQALFALADFKIDNECKTEEAPQPSNSPKIKASPKASPRRDELPSQAKLSATSSDGGVVKFDPSSSIALSEAGSISLPEASAVDLPSKRDDLLMEESRDSKTFQARPTSGPKQPLESTDFSLSVDESFDFGQSNAAPTGTTDILILDSSAKFDSTDMSHSSVNLVESPEKPLPRMTSAFPTNSNESEFNDESIDASATFEEEEEPLNASTVDITVTFTLTINERLMVLQTLIPRIEECGKEGEQYAGVVELMEMKSKQDLLKLVMGGRKAQVSVFGGDVCFSILVDICQDIGPYLFPERIFEGKMTEQKLLKEYKSCREKELEFWKILTTHFRQLIACGSLPASELIELFTKAFLHHMNNDQRASRKLKEFLSAHLGALNTKPAAATTPSVQKPNEAPPAEKKNEKDESIPQDNKFSQAKNVLNLAFMQKESSPTKQKSTNDNLLKLSKSPKATGGIGQKVLRGVNFGEISEFDDDDDNIDFNRIIGSASTKPAAAAKPIARPSMTSKKPIVRDDDFDEDF